MAGYLEDYAQGDVREFGDRLVDRDEVLAFAERYDPQYIHTDPGRAEAGPFGGLIASGWHTTAMMMRMLVDHYLDQRASLASPGIDELRWLRPVRPGDRLRVRATVLEVRPSASKPDRGLIRTLVEVLNQDGETVLSMKAMNLLLRRPA